MWRKTSVQTGWKQRKTLVFSILDEKQDFCSNMLGAEQELNSDISDTKEDFCSNILGAAMQDFCSTIIYAKQHFCANMLDAKEDFCSQILDAKENFRSIILGVFKRL